MKLRGLIALLVLAVPACAKQAGPREPNARNELPFGYLDSPKSGAMVEREMPATGWAMDDGGVAAILIYLDNHFIARTTLTEKRPDVSKAYPSYTHGGDTHGWGIVVPLGGDAKPGPHTVLVQAVDDQGATRDIGIANVELTR